MQHLTLMYEADLALYKNSGKPYWQMYPKLNALKLHPSPTKKKTFLQGVHILMISVIPSLPILINNCRVVFL